MAYKKPHPLTTWDEADVDDLWEFLAETGKIPDAMRHYYIMADCMTDDMALESVFDDLPERKQRTIVQRYCADHDLSSGWSDWLLKDDRKERGEVLPWD